MPRRAEPKDARLERWEQEVAATASAVRAERFRQLEKWGFQTHQPEVWLAILSEEVGEMSEAMLQARFDSKTYLKDVEREAIHVAAVASAIVQAHKFGGFERGT